MTPADLARTLFGRYKVWTVAIDTANVHGVRVTRQLVTAPKELDVPVAHGRSWRLRPNVCAEVADCQARARFIPPQP